MHESVINRIGKVVDTVIAGKKYTRKEIAAEAGVNEARLYKWLNPNVKAEPKGEDETKLEEWLKKMELVPYGTANNITDYKDECIKILKEHNKYLQDLKILEHQNAFLQNTVVINLNDLSKNQLVLLSQIRAASRIEAIRFAGDDKKKLQKELDTLDKLVGEFSNGDSQKDKT